MSPVYLGWFLSGPALGLPTIVTAVTLPDIDPEADRVRAVSTCQRWAVSAEKGLAPGEFGDDRSELLGDVGADDDVGETDLLPSALEFLDGGGRIARERGKRFRLPSRVGVGVGGRHERGDPVAEDRHMERQLDVARSAHVASQARDLDPRLAGRLREGDRVGDLGRHRPGPRTANGHGHGRSMLRAVEIPQHPDGLTNVGEPLARRGDG
jgi:hypothetical protein